MDTVRMNTLLITLLHAYSDYEHTTGYAHTNKYSIYEYSEYEHNTEHTSL